ncbi:hypothetical protein NL108_015635 [Boleophthalmus pectinirostris]|nr:hypothetical protein NL108_015635 [Boleophthalmus pectinirostris]
MTNTTLPTKYFILSLCPDETGEAETTKDMNLQVFILCAICGLACGVGVLSDSVNAAVGGTVMFTTSLAPTQTTGWSFGSTNIITSSSAGNFTAPEYEGRITLFISTGSLELRNVALSDTGEYSVTVVPVGGAALTGRTTLNVYD